MHYKETIKILTKASIVLIVGVSQYIYANHTHEHKKICEPIHLAMFKAEMRCKVFKEIEALEKAKFNFALISGEEYVHPDPEIMDYGACTEFKLRKEAYDKNCYVNPYDSLGKTQ